MLAVQRTVRRSAPEAARGVDHDHLVPQLAPPPHQSIQIGITVGALGQGSGDWTLGLFPGTVAAAAAVGRWVVVVIAEG